MPRPRAAAGAAARAATCFIRTSDGDLRMAGISGMRAPGGRTAAVRTTRDRYVARVNDGHGDHSVYATAPARTPSRDHSAVRLPPHTRGPPSADRPSGGPCRAPGPQQAPPAAKI